MRAQVREEIVAIHPLDDLEREQIAEALAWLDSGVEIFRTAKPATPSQHLVSYFAVVDADQILLVDHKSAELWLPPGGHVEPNEHPRETVRRELQEELGFSAPHPIAAPLMLTCSTTVGHTPGHVDVSLWYLLRTDRTQPIAFDATEFHSIRWFPLTQVPLDRSDPHMRRFLTKYAATL